MDQKRYVEGLAMGSAAFVIWGLLPLYWKWVSAISPYEIFAQRVMWSFLLVVIILLYKRQLKAFFQLARQPKHLLVTIGPAFFISANWMGFIWGVNNGYVLETSLGYYINPLVLTLFGRVFFKEHLTKMQKIGMGFAAVGVVYKTLTYGRIPYVALLLAFSFAIYGLLKKKSQFSSVEGFGIETLIIGVPSLVYLIKVESSGAGIVGNLPPVYWGMIAISGILTAVPILLYAEGTKRLPLSIVGFLQYIAPTISLFLGIFVFHEAFDANALLAFVFIWIGLVIFTREQYLMLKTKKQSVAVEER
ncbi:MAG: chloramphenicol-sensitive protein RarD [Clostridiales bacterium]|jgi:chloramphenicol-sensitive protein RarD|nr:chloramphenicol-sensitive protein RarD [Clostridiales bacterium]MDN5297620.1 chloramphenicol-sensitive protein RarD [Clostridiales bacterium]